MSKINFLDAPSLIPFPTKIYIKIDGAFLDEQPKTLPRIWEIDFLRGLCILLMIIDHFFFLGYHLYGAALSQTATGYEFVEFCYFYWYQSPRDVIHVIVLFFFFSLSGISCYLSRSNLKRGFGLAYIAFCYSLITLEVDNLFDVGCYSGYGVLNFLATCILIYGVVEIICRKNNIALWAIGSISAIVVTVIFFCYTPPSDLDISLAWLFPTKYFEGLNMLDYSCVSPFTQRQISPGDFFPFIPYSAFFFAGMALAPILYKNKRTLFPSLDGRWNKPVCAVGKFTLVIYVLHIAALVLLFEIITLIATGQAVIFNFAL